MLGPRENNMSHDDDSTVRVIENSVEEAGVMALPHWHDYYELLYIISGQSIQVINGFTETMDEGDIVLINPGAQHTTTAVTADGCDILVVQFYLPGVNFDNLLCPDSQYITPFVQGGPSHRGYYSHIGRDNAAILYIAHQILAEHRMGLKGHETIIKGLLYQLLGYLIRDGRFDVTTQANSEQLKAVHAVCRYVEKRYADDVSLKAVAAHVGYTAEYLSKLFKKVTGRHYKAYCDYVRMNQAERLLHEGGISLSEVAARVGCRGAADLSRVYKRVFGCSPKALHDQNPLK